MENKDTLKKISYTTIDNISFMTQGNRTELITARLFIRKTR
jgi:hypothetical protein